LQLLASSKTGNSNIKGVSLFGPLCGPCPYVGIPFSKWTCLHIYNYGLNHIKNCNWPVEL